MRLPWKSIDTAVPFYFHKYCYVYNSIVERRFWKAIWEKYDAEEATTLTASVTLNISMNNVLRTELNSININNFIINKPTVIFVYSWSTPNTTLKWALF
jgi:hypothetical protein